MSQILITKINIAMPESQRMKTPYYGHDSKEPPTEGITSIKLGDRHYPLFEDLNGTCIYLDGRTRVKVEIDYLTSEQWGIATGSIPC